MGYEDHLSFKIDLSEVISRQQIDTRIKVDTGLDISRLIYESNIKSNPQIFIIFENIRSDINDEAINYLTKLPSILNTSSCVFFCIFTSPASVNMMNNKKIKLDILTLQEVTIVLNKRYRSLNLTNEEIYSIYELSEGVIRKLERIIYFLDDGSVQEVLDMPDIFDDIYYSESISQTILKQIERLKTDPTKFTSLVMLKILSVLKNGETLTNLKSHKLGKQLSVRNTKELIELGLAKTITIDNVTIIIKVNPIIKDYVLKFMSSFEIDTISEAYLDVTIVEIKGGIRIGTTTRKVLDNGYNSEDDNGTALLLLNIEKCQRDMLNPNLNGDEAEMLERRMRKLVYLSKCYVYALSNSSKYRETIIAAQKIIEQIDKIEPLKSYAYYYYIGSAYRMLGNYPEASRYLTKARAGCPEHDSDLLSQIYINELYLLESLDINKAISYARKNKNSFKAKSQAYIISDEILSLGKSRQDRLKSLDSLEKKARKNDYLTLANNILFTLNKEKRDIDKLATLETILRTERNTYNLCRAIVDRAEFLVANGLYDKIKEIDIKYLLNIYEYYFSQRFDTQLTRCFKIIWEISNYYKSLDIAFSIYYKAIIIWKLIDDKENETKYSNLVAGLDNPINTATLPLEKSNK